MTPVQEFHKACRLILSEREKPALNYAVSYAHAGLAMRDAEEARVQCLYILGNITGWRGELANEVRQSLKRLAKPGAWEVADA